MGVRELLRTAPTPNSTSQGDTTSCDVSCVYANNDLFLHCRFSKVDWALGSMLYEINALPWSFVGDGSEDPLTGCSENAQVSGCTVRVDMPSMTCLRICRRALLRRQPHFRAITRAWATAYRMPTRHTFRWIPPVG